MVVKTNPYILRCYAKKENDYIIGICIDLNLIVRGNSFEDVKDEMTQAIRGYLSCVNEKNLQDLIPRPAPPQIRLEYFLIRSILNSFKAVISFKKTFQIFFEQITPQNFSVNLSA